MPGLEKVSHCKIDEKNLSRECTVSKEINKSIIDNIDVENLPMFNKFSVQICNIPEIIIERNETFSENKIVNFQNIDIHHSLSIHNNGKIETNVSQESFIDESSIITDAVLPRIISNVKDIEANFELFNTIEPISSDNSNENSTDDKSGKRSLSLNDITEKVEIHEKESLITSPSSGIESVDSMTKLATPLKRIDKSSKYKLIRTIGRGNFAKVKLAKHMATGMFVAIKIIDKTKLEKKVLKQISREVSLMKELSHPNIVQLLEVMENETTLYLVMEYASGGELFDYWTAHGCMKEDEARKKFRQMISAVKYCHSKGIVHRDLKAENLLLDKKMEIKLADFGFANKFSPDSTLTTFCGSPPYAAPELFQGIKYIGPEVDVWALGVILFIMVGGRMPFDAGTFLELKKKVINLRIEFPYFMSVECSNLLKKMLVVNMKDRATLENIIKDPWFNGGGLSKMMNFTDEQFIPCPIILRSLKDMGFDDEDIKTTFNEKKFNSIHATYLLLKPSLSNEYAAEESHHSKFTSTNNNISTLNVKSMLPVTQEKVRNNAESHSYTGATAAHLAKTFKHWLFNKSEESQSYHKKESLTSNDSQSKELQKQWQQAMPHMTKDTWVDPNISIPKGANQQAILATLNQTSLSKHHKVAMFQANISGFHAQKGMHEKNNAITKLDALKVDKKSTNEVTYMGKFTVENVRLNETENHQNDTKHDLNGSENKKKKKEKSKTNHENKSEISDKLQKSKKKTSLSGNTSSNMASAAAYIRTIQPFWARFDVKVKPRAANFYFSMNTTSSKHPDDILCEILRILNENKFSYEFIEKYLLLCNLNSKNIEIFGDSIQWEMEVCRVPILFMNAVRLKRISGNAFVYRTVASTISQSLKL